MVPSLIHFKGRHPLLRLVRQRLGPLLDGEKFGCTCWLDRGMGHEEQHGERLVDGACCRIP